MSGYVYLIRNGGLHKIGRTINIEQRMKQLKPDEIIAVLKTYKYQELEKKLHRTYRSVRLPQSEYFRLRRSDVNDVRKILSGHKGFFQELKEFFVVSLIALLFIVFCFALWI
tara:strand:+ start:160 stop:495 length:336 start_codon:yes stop_codon:yes gene_type:complete